MEVEDAQFSNPLCYAFEENIGNTDICVSFKINIPDLDEDEQQRMVGKLITYMKAVSDVQMYTHGIHMEGKRQIPHIHLHLIISPSVGWTKVMTNPSQHRKRWFAKEGYFYPEGKIIEMKTQIVDTTKPKFHFLSYPMKEGKYFKNKEYFWFLNDQMTTDMKMFLINYAKHLYEIKVANDLSSDRSEERKELKYSEVLSVAKNYKGGSTYLDFQKYMEEAYIAKLISSGENVPDIDNYKKNLKRAAVQLKYFKTYEI